MRRQLQALLLFPILGMSSCFALEQGIPSELNVRVVDESGEPISGAEAKIGFSFVGSTRGLTDQDGRISHSGTQTGTWFVGIEKEGYYDTRGRGPMARPPELVEVTLKRKIDPVAMVVGEVPGKSLPATDEPIGYDLEKADWVRPYGEGVKSDLVFEGGMEVLNIRETGFRDEWWAELSMKFPNPDDGFILFDGVVSIERNDPESGLVSIQEAPETNYLNQEIFQRINRTPRKRENTFAWDTQYVVFRVRTEVNENGDVIRANYGKIYKPMYAGPLFPKDSVWLNSIFYFNPTPNNRSLEYNKENLNSHQSSRRFPY